MDDESVKQACGEFASSWGRLPVVYLEVFPLVQQQPSAALIEKEEPCLSCASVKRQLEQLALKSILTTSTLPRKEQLCLEWLQQDEDEEERTSSRNRSLSSSESLCCAGRLVMQSVDDKDDHDSSSRRKDPLVFWFRQDDPTRTRPWPCHCIAYAILPGTGGRPNKGQRHEVVIHNATLVRIQDFIRTPQGDPNGGSAIFVPSKPWSWNPNIWTGESWQPPVLPESLQHQVLATSPSSTLVALRLRLGLLFSQEERIHVGTTAQAMVRQSQVRQRRSRIRAALKRDIIGNTTTTNFGMDAKRGSVAPTTTTTRKSSLLLGTRALLVHSPHHGDGKSLLVETLARRHANVCIIRPGPLLAKYGIHADAALETIFHQAVVSAAVKRESLCLVLDPLDGFVVSTSTTAGDAAVPVLHAMAAFLRRLTQQLQQQKEWPFPTKNPLYGSLSSGGGGGASLSTNANGSVLPVSVCLVGIVTCPDDSPILDCLVAGRYRLPPQTASSRLAAFTWALRGQRLSTTLQARLRVLAAAAVWARGGAFGKVGCQVRQRLCAAKQEGSVVVDQEEVTEQMFQEALRMVQHCVTGSSTSSYQVQFVDSSSPSSCAQTQSNVGVGLFGSVGGNLQAKMALHDALALDPTRRKLLASLGMSPPTGILLYGPPGTGKTLLAKAVARLLQSRSSSNLGGAFVSLSSADIVRAQVGSGEKMVVSAFDTARRNAPAVIFIDEFQALFVARDSGGSSRLSSTLLHCMDDVKQWGDLERQSQEDEDGRVVILAATNTPWMIDSAFLRPGRFDRVVHVGLPDVEERQAVLLLHVAPMETALDDNTQGLEELCQRLAHQTDGFSGADLAALCRAAAVQCLLSGDKVLEERHFAMALESGMQASSSTRLVDRIQQWHP